VSLIFVALLPYENILTTKFSQIMVYHSKNRKVILTLVWLLELQVGIRCLHSYKLAK